MHSPAPHSPAPSTPGASAPPAVHISLAGASALSGLSVRTWQRRIEDGQILRCADSTGRTLIPWAAIQAPWMGDWTPEDEQTLQQADQGSSGAQADMGTRFALQALQAAPTPPTHGPDALRVAVFFLHKAAEQGVADAMYWLGLLHAAGLGGCADGIHQAQALMWLTRAAVQGHRLAQHQVDALLQGLGIRPM